MANRKKIRFDGAFLKKSGSDLRVQPRRLSMFLAGGLIGFFGIVLIFASLQSIFNRPENEAIGWNSILIGVVIGAGLIGVAYYAIQQGRKQVAAHFNNQTRTVTIGKDNTIPYDSVNSVFIKRAGTMRTSKQNSIIVAVGIVHGQNQPVQLGNISESKQNKAFESAIDAARIICEQLGNSEPEALKDLSTVYSTLSSGQNVTMSL